MRFVDLTGRKFGRLTVVATAGKNKRGRILWACECSCGATTIVAGSDLTTGNTKSCGCLQKDRTSQAAHKHGFNGTSTYSSWACMKERCLNPKNKGYKDYGGRGITVCERWMRFEDFLADMGEKPEGATIERIDNDKGYFPENCRWASKLEQNRNRRSNRRITFQGETRTLSEWAEILGIHWGTLLSRLKKHPVNIAFTLKHRERR